MEIRNEKKLFGCTLSVSPFTMNDLSVMSIEVDVNKATDKKPAWAKVRFHGTPLAATMRMPEAKLWGLAYAEIMAKAKEVLDGYRKPVKTAKKKPTKKS